jgi:hypothetical protein
MYTEISECYKVRNLLSPQTTATGAQAYLAPTATVRNITIRAQVKMGNAADLELSLKYADDASGTNAAAWASNVPVFKDNTRQSDAKVVTITDATGDYIVDFCVDPSAIPAGKYIGLSYANSNAANLLAVQLIEETGYCPVA